MGKNKMSEVQQLKCDWTEMPHTELVELCAKIHKETKGYKTQNTNMRAEVSDYKAILKKLKIRPDYIERLEEQNKALRQPYEALAKKEDEIDYKLRQLKSKEQIVLESMEELSKAEKKLILMEKLTGAILQTIIVYSKNGITTVHTKKYDANMKRGIFWFVNDKYEWKRLRGIKSVEIQGKTFEFDEETGETEIIEGDPDFSEPQTVTYTETDKGIIL